MEDIVENPDAIGNAIGDKGATFWAKYVKGMEDLDKKKEKELAKLGIRTLQRTPGKLINPRGYIPGALGAFGIPWGKLIGPKETVEKVVGMKLKKGARGALLSRRRYIDKNGKVKFGIFAISLMPHPNTPTKKMKRINERMRVLGKIAHNHMSDLIYPIWEPLVKNKSRKPWTGYHYFMSLNAQNIGTSLDWSKLLISNGKLSPPKQSLPNWYDAGKKQIHIILPKSLPPDIDAIGIGLFDVITGDFYHISPEQVIERLEQIPKIPGKSKPIPGKPKPFELTWELKRVKRYHAPQECNIQKWGSRFYIYTYYRKQRPEVRTQKPALGEAEGLEVRSEKPIIPSLHHSISPSSISHLSSLYSPSISAKMKARKNRTEKRNSLPIVISVVNM